MLVRRHYVPKHASWLNMVEIEIGVLAKQRNAARARIKWMFTTDKARAKMGRAYPKLDKVSTERTHCLHGMLGFQGPAQPSPALGDALNAG